MQTALDANLDRQRGRIRGTLRGQSARDRGAAGGLRWPGLRARGPASRFGVAHTGNPMFRTPGTGRKKRIALALAMWLAWLFLTMLAHPGEGLARPDASDSGSASSLHTKYEALRGELDHSSFRMPLVLTSEQTDGQLEGDLYGVVAYAFPTVRAALKGPRHWCEVLMLHLNVKNCRSSERSAANLLTVYVGTKHSQPPETAFRLQYSYSVVSEAADYLQIALAADTGPLGTKDYRIRFEAVPVADQQTFIRLTYAYAYGTIARLAMQTYLATVGRSKVGFTVVGRQPNGEAAYVTGVRGAMERNAMRYYLAIVAYLDALPAPSEEQLERRLREWFALTEQHARQLHEITQSEYLDMKRREYGRQ